MEMLFPEARGSARHRLKGGHGLDAAAGQMLHWHSGGAKTRLCGSVNNFL